MTQPSRIRDDFIDAVFRPVMGFFAGLAFGYLVQLAQVSSWQFALIICVVLAAFVAAILFFDTVIRRLIDRIFGGGPGIKPSHKKHVPHWFVRFGWMAALVLGMVAVFVLPEGALAWLI